MRQLVGLYPLTYNGERDAGSGVAMNFRANQYFTRAMPGSDISMNTLMDIGFLITFDDWLHTVTTVCG